MLNRLLCNGVKLDHNGLRFLSESGSFMRFLGEEFLRGVRPLSSLYLLKVSDVTDVVFHLF